MAFACLHFVVRWWKSEHETIIRALSEQEMNGNKWLENNGWEFMRSPKKACLQECLTREMGWRLQLVFLTEVMRCERAGVYQTRLVCTYQHAQDSNHAIYRVWEVRWSFTTLSHLLSLFLLYIQIHTDLLILLSFVTVTQELIEPYLSEIYSFCASHLFPFSDQSTSIPSSSSRVMRRPRFAQ